MNERPTRFEATLNLACAAMTMLICGHVVDREIISASRARRRIVPLREEFSEFFRVHCHYIKLLCPAACPDLGDPNCGPTYTRRSLRIGFLLRVRVHPKEIARALQAAESRAVHMTALDYSSIGSDLGVDSRDVSFCQTARREGVDLGKCWDALRRELARHCEGIGGQQ